MSESRGTQVCAEAYRKMKEVRYYRLVFKLRAQIFEAETRSCVAETPDEIFVSLLCGLVVHSCYRDEGSRLRLLVL